MTKPITKEKKPTSKRKPPIKEEFQVSPWLEDYLDCFDFQYKPVTQAFIERISKELILWAKTNDKAYKISQFFTPKHIGYGTYMRWAEKYETFVEAFKLAKTIIGDRRETGALERKLDAGTVIQMMPAYDPEWKAMVKERAEIKAQATEKSQGGTKFIVMEKFTLDEKKEESNLHLSPEEVASQVSMKKIK